MQHPSTPHSQGGEQTDRVVKFDGLRLATSTWGSGPIGIVMLHDGLGSIAQWRSVPAQVQARTGVAVLAYERAGHGTSTPIPTGPWPTRWLHREADVLARLLDELDLERPFIVGHSDGASAALIHAANNPERTGGLLAIAPHSWVEEICYQSIIEMRTNRDRIESGLDRFHQAPKALFEAWSGVWVSDEFRTWDIRPALHSVKVPTVIAQGELDAYASVAQAQLTAEAIGSNATWRLLPGLGHIAHHDDQDAIAKLIVEVHDAQVC